VGDMKVEEILSKLPPKIILDHRWEILSMLSWRSSLIFKDEQKFTISELKDAIINEIEQSNNPLIRRMYQRSLNAMEYVIGALLKSRLLTKKDDVFYKSNNFNDIYYLIKKRIKTSIKRFIAWALWYLHHRKINSFTTNELIKNISYDDKEYLEELYHLYVWRDSKLHKLLEKVKATWILIEEPHLSRKPILLDDIHNRLHSTLFEICRVKRKIDEKELLHILRSLESDCAERVLKKLKLTYKGGKWRIDESAIKRIHNILFPISSLSFNWPLFGVRRSTNPHFKVEGTAHNVYVDMPNGLVDHFLIGLYSLSTKYNHDMEKLYEKSLELKNKFNELIRQYGDWYSLVLVKRFKKTGERIIYYAKRPFGIQIRINWNKFQNFLEEYAKSDIPLEKKYEYLFVCRGGSHG